MVGFGNAAKKIFCVVVAEHPLLLISVTLSVPEPEFPQVTLIEFEFDVPLIIPPVTVHEYALPAANATE